MPHETTLVSMKMDRKAAEKRSTGEVPSDRPVYPWGLSVNLDHEALDKLGMSKLPTVGKSLYLTALVDVTSVSENESREGGKTTTNRSVSLQITNLALGPVGRKSDADALYGDGD